MRSMLGSRSVWSVAQHMVILYLESCSSSVENLVLALHCVAQSNAYYLSQILYNDCLVMGAFEQRVGCFWRRSLCLLDCIPGKKMDDMLMCCILVMICWCIHFYTHSFAVLSLTNICRLLWIRTWRWQWIEEQRAQVLSLLFSYNCRYSLFGR